MGWVVESPGFFLLGITSRERGGERDKEIDTETEREREIDGEGGRERERERERDRLWERVWERVREWVGEINNETEGARKIDRLWERDIQKAMLANCICIQILKSEKCLDESQKRVFYLDEKWHLLDETTKN